MQGQSLGSVEFGQILRFAVSNRAADGTAIAGFTPAYYDLIDPDTASVILLNQPLTKVSGINVWCAEIDTGDIPTDQDVAFLPNHTYAILVKAALGATPTTFMLFSFTVTGGYSARLQRLLGLEGENLLVDNMAYDSGGNCLSYRVRVFNSRATALAATSGITDVPEPGELWTFTITQEYSAGRTLRQWHLSTIDQDQGGK